MYKNSVFHYVESGIRRYPALAHPSSRSANTLIPTAPSFGQWKVGALAACRLVHRVNSVHPTGSSIRIFVRKKLNPEWNPTVGIIPIVGIIPTVGIRQTLCFVWFGSRFRLSDFSEKIPHRGKGDFCPLVFCFLLLGFASFFHRVEKKIDRQHRIATCSRSHTKAAEGYTARRRMGGCRVPADTEFRLTESKIRCSKSLRQISKIARPSARKSVLHIF